MKATAAAPPTATRSDDNGSDSLGSKGIRVVGTAHPTLENNQITGNHLEGISYEESGGGTAEGNTVSSNIATGIAVRNQATPTVSGNLVKNNGNCGLLLQGDANPTLSGNTVSGNGQDLCDQRTGPAIAPIAHSCSTANSGLNPDPTRYLAVVAEDGNGAPIVGVSVSVTLFDDHGSQVGSDIETTDSNGVALLLDNTVYGSVPQGTLSGTVGVGAGTTTPAIFTACGNIANPGTITVSPAGLSDVTVNIHAGTTGATNVDAQPGLVYGGKARIGPALSLFSSPSQVKMLDGDYTLALRATIGSASYLLYPSVTVSGTTTLDVDTNTAHVVRVTYSASTASGATVTSTELMFINQDPWIDQFYMYALSSTDLNVEAGTYGVNGDLMAVDASSNIWDYSFELGSHAIATGNAPDLSFGGPVITTVATLRSSYAPGDQVVIQPRVLDGHGYKLDLAWNLGALVTTGLGHGRLVTYQGLLGTRFLATDQRGNTVLASQAVSANTPIVTVKDPSGTVVYQTNQSDNTLSEQAFTLAGDAPTGTYDVAFSWDVGPYASAPLTANSTFTVQ